MSLTPEFFDRMYAADPDPWGFASRWYEQRKYALTLAVLPHQSYRSALEIGCSIGVLTAQLAGRCQSLLGLDPSAQALASARSRVPPSVHLLQGAVPGGWPTGEYDLVVLSEVGYYLAPDDLELLLALIERDLSPGGLVVACHWRHPVADYPQTGDAVHRALERWPRSTRIDDPDFLLDVLHPGGEAVSVATTAGLT